MLLNPRYSTDPIITFDGPAVQPLTPLMRQRRRMETLAAGFTQDEWDTPSRCEGWTVRDVYAHLASINPFYEISAKAAVKGEPTQMLTSFDPCATPPIMVDQLGPLSGDEVLQTFVATNDALCTTLAQLDQAQWDMLAVSPPGWVPVRLLALHALWDSWVHELDVCVPLARPCPMEEDEVRLSLMYVSALSPAFAIGAGRDYPGEFAVAATAPYLTYTVRVDDSVHVTPHSSPADVGSDVPVLRGEATALVDALTTRTPLPAGSPQEWTWLLNGLKTAWDLELLDEAARTA
jgi:uncharacterized protein (TIGR03083 family)